MGNDPYQSTLQCLKSWPSGFISATLVWWQLSWSNLSADHGVIQQQLPHSIIHFFPPLQTFLVGVWCGFKLHLKNYMFIFRSYMNPWNPLWTNLWSYYIFRWWHLRDARHPLDNDLLLEIIQASFKDLLSCRQSRGSRGMSSVDSYGFDKGAPSCS